MKLVRTVILAAIGVFALTLSASAEVERYEYKIDVPADWYFTASDSPCFTETIHVTGTYKEYVNTFVNPSSGVHWTFHQTTDNLTAVGLTTGDTYAYSGPQTEVVGSRDNLDYVEFTLHNINHFVGPGRDNKIYLRTLIHVTIDPKTGQTKVEVLKDDALCK